MIKRMLIKFCIEAIIEAFLAVMVDRSAASSSKVLKRVTQDLIDEKEALKLELIAKVK